MWFLYAEWQIRRVPDTRLKPDGYGYEYEFLPVGTGTGTNFYPQSLCWRAGNYSTRPEPDPLPSLISDTGFTQFFANDVRFFISKWEEDY
jgi:hypothetical protein